MLAHVHIQKTGGTTLNYILRCSHGLRYCNARTWDKSSTLFTAADLKRLRLICPHLRSISGHRVTPASDLPPDIDYVTFLRDPIERTVSHYQYRVQRFGDRESLHDWLRHGRIRNLQVKRFAGGKEDIDVAKDNLKQCAFVGLTEHFDKSLVMAKCVLQPYRLRIAYQRRNTATDNTIKRQLLTNKETRQLLEKANHLDLELYRWARDELFTAQVGQYGPTLSRDVERFEAQRSGSKNLRYYTGTVWQRYAYRTVLNLYRQSIS